jgi:hypothetical protein
VSACLFSAGLRVSGRMDSSSTRVVVIEDPRRLHSDLSHLRVSCVLSLSQVRHRATRMHALHSIQCSCKDRGSLLLSEYIVPLPAWEPGHMRASEDVRVENTGADRKICTLVSTHAMLPNVLLCPDVRTIELNLHRCS